MTDESLDRRLAGVLSELEDVEVALTQRESKLAKELADVHAELDRIHAVKAAIHGKPAKRDKGPSEATQRRERVASIEAWIAGLDNGQTFSGRDVVDAVDGITAQGIGPVLAGLARNDYIKEVGVNDDGRKTYQRA